MSLLNATMPVTDIKVGKRIRQEPGDLDALAKSIAERGLLHPVIVAPTNDLLAGWRRLEAVKLLGWDEVPVRVATDVADVAAALRIERDENTCRKDFTVSEAEAIARTITALEQPQAKRRQGRPGAERSAKLAEHSPRPRDVAAEATGFGRETIRKAAVVVDAAEDESLPDEVRALALDAQREMDATGKVDPAYRKVRDAIAPPQEQGSGESDDREASGGSPAAFGSPEPPGLPPPDPTLGYRAQASKAKAKVRQELLALDPERVVETSDDPKAWADFSHDVRAWLDRLDGRLAGPRLKAVP